MSATKENPDTRDSGSWLPDKATRLQREHRRALMILIVCFSLWRAIRQLLRTLTGELSVGKRKFSKATAHSVGESASTSQPVQSSSRDCGIPVCMREFP